MSTLTTYRPMHVPTIWLVVVLITALVFMAIELGLAGVQRSSPQPVRVQSQPTTIHPTMSGDLIWLTTA